MGHEPGRSNSGGRQETWSHLYDDVGYGFEVRIEGVHYNVIEYFMESEVWQKLAANRSIYGQRDLNPNKYVAEFEKLKAQLTVKFGTPIKDETIWKSSNYKGEPEKLGIAYSVGDSSSETIWEDETTVVTLSMSGENYVVQLNIDYESKLLTAEMFKQIKKSMTETYRADNK